ncbi:hypothetical protein PXO_05429 [Xanthomonas oryzae pv. oryzae PXO99A]|uniref:Uncharacterized protein n=1 Tax=Xanthomonas oryzae pv. oryzae (strain PXO99A) TaxID=360094 RepID=A0A0K0GFK7_XANOP|nr:hypothetical protein PXO_05429 [Xanthomonas oryzae pv. oryzae PXO99A]
MVLTLPSVLLWMVTMWRLLVTRSHRVAPVALGASVPGRSRRSGA